MVQRWRMRRLFTHAWPPGWCRRPPALLPLLALLLALLTAFTSQATDVSDRPLNPSTQARPNVIFGLDDSGSMDFEVLLSTNDGALWWNAMAGSGWGQDAGHPVAALRNANAPWFNPAGAASAQWRKLTYLFPNGAGVAQRRLGDANYDHFAIAPTRQLAWLRSAAYNPLYYDPTQTYRPWEPAYLNGTVQRFADADSDQPLSHPLHTDSFDVANPRRSGADAGLFTAAQHVFTLLPGMRVPAGALVCNATVAPNCTPSMALASGFVVGAGAAYRAAIDYLPATYWVRGNCTPSADADDTRCVLGPDGATLVRREIVRSSYANSAAYKAELQNFANWFQYYRKRKLMAAASMGKVLAPLTGMRVGVVPFNNRRPVTMYDMDSTTPASNWQRVAGLVYGMDSGGGTPTRDTLSFVGEQFRTNRDVVQYACQRNNAFIVTDGFAYASGGQVPGYSQATWGSGAPYQTVYPGSLADLALGYYTVNLNPGLSAGRVPRSDRDRNPDPHMNTYALTLGARGTVWTGTDATPPTQAVAWPAPVDDRSPTSIDDLWHATINGRGKMYLATTPDETARNIQAGLADMLSQLGAQSAASVANVNLERSDGRVYLAGYNSVDWSGDLAARSINANTGEIGSGDSWSAATLLGQRDWTTRAIATSVAGKGVAFTADRVGTLVNPSRAYGSTTGLMDYLRGARTGEGSTFRTRGKLLGAVVNAEPVVDRDQKLAYLATGEGMLHAFDTRSGAERWAYVPEAVLPTLGATSKPGYVFSSRLDGTPTLGTLASGQRILVGGLGSAGRSFYALDVSKAATLDEAGLAAASMWTFPASGDTVTQAKVGYALGRPVIARHPKMGDVVLVTSGYDRGAAFGDGKGRLWALSATTGAVLREWATPHGASGAEAGLAQVSALREADGSSRVAFGGDLLGNLWRFDLDSGAVQRLAVLTGADNKPQPVTAAPELVSTEGRTIVLLGTGRLLASSDYGNGAVRSFYAISDGVPLDNPRSALVRQTYTRGGAPEFSSLKVDWTTSRGWYVDLPSGEQVTTLAQAAYGSVSFTTSMMGSADCSQQSYQYLLDPLTGGPSDGALISSVQLSNSATASRVMLVRTADRQLISITRTSDGVTVPRALMKTGSLKPAKVAWIGLRR